MNGSHFLEKLVFFKFCSGMSLTKPNLRVPSSGYYCNYIQIKRSLEETATSFYLVTENTTMVDNVYHACLVQREISMTGWNRNALMHLSTALTFVRSHKGNGGVMKWPVIVYVQIWVNIWLLQAQALQQLHPKQQQHHHKKLIQQHREFQQARWTPLQMKVKLFIISSLQLSKWGKR